MTSYLSTFLIQLPAAKRFLNRLVDDIGRGLSLIVLLPEGLEVDLIWSAIKMPLERMDIKFNEVYLSEISQDLEPHLAIAEALQVSWPRSDTPRTVANLMNAEGIPNLLLLQGLGELLEENQTRWLNLVSGWDQASQSVVDGGGRPNQLLIIDVASKLVRQIPESSANLAVRWWWGIPSALEMRLLCRLAGAEEEPSGEARWREYILPALVGNDVELAESLWEKAHLGIDSLKSVLVSFAEKRSWDQQSLKDWGAEELSAESGHYYTYESDSPPPEFRRLWGHGALAHSPEYGMELHPATLMLLGQERELKHRIWRGQVELLSPLLDGLRIDICDYLTQSYGRDWPVRWVTPSHPEEEAEAREDPLSTQYPHLVRVLKVFQLQQSERNFKEQAEMAKGIRNKLYHYNIVEFRDFDLLRKRIRSK